MATRSAQIPVTNVVTLLEDENGLIRGEHVVIYNRGALSVYIGGPAVSTTTGFELGSGQSISVDLSEANQEIYAIAASGTQAVHVLAL